MNVEANEIQIRNTVEFGWILVLLCEDERQAENLYQLIGEPNNYEVRIYRGTIIKTISIAVTVKDLDAILTVDTTKNESNYFPVKKLLNGEVKFISVGYLDNKRQLMYNYPKPLISLLLPGQSN